MYSGSVFGRLRVLALQGTMGSATLRCFNDDVTLLVNEMMPGAEDIVVV